MAIINDKCSCGQAIIVLTGKDSKMPNNRCDGKQAYYPDEPLSDYNNYNIFRCKSCLSVADETVPSFKYDKSQSPK